MKTNRPTSTEMVFILDRSGSMGGLEADTIGGFNGMIESQKAEPGAAVVTTVLFDDRTDVIANRVPLNQVAPLTSREYFVRGCTALLDAVGNTIRRVNHAQKASPWGRPDKTIFVITTDGMENASKHYSLAEVRRMIEKRRRRARYAGRARVPHHLHHHGQLHHFQPLRARHPRHPVHDRNTERVRTGGSHARIHRFRTTRGLRR